MLEFSLNLIQPYIGQRMCEIAQIKGFALKNRKGDIGQIVEQLFGVKPSSYAGPDLPELGIEIKTLPVNLCGAVIENTYVNKISLPFRETDFEHSCLWQKIKKIIFVPVIGDKQDKLENRRLGQPFIWEASGGEFRQLKQDWLDLTQYLRLGMWTLINSKLGEILHIRPKAAHGRDLSTFDALGQEHCILPMGFYLRKSFTQLLIEKNYA